MARYGLIRNDTVENVCEWDGSSAWSDPEKREAAVIPEHVGRGWRRIGGDWQPPLPPPPPASVSPLQLRRALRQIGLKATVDGFVATLDEEVQEAWEYATEIRRDSPLIAMAAKGLGLDEAQADDLFRLAGTFTG